MSMQRTPPHATLISGSESGSGSVPNLSTYCNEDFYSNVNSRKRKERTEENDYKKDFTQFRMEMMQFLEEFGKTQNNNLNLIREEISEIKNEIRTIKSTAENFTSRFEHLNTEIENIKAKTTTTEDKIKHIENEITQIKGNQHNSSSTSKFPDPCPENLILELKDRCDREKNIIIVGISELNDKNSKSRRDYDYEKVLNLITQLHDNCPKPIKTIRLGKYIPSKSRPIKVCFDNTHTPKCLLRSKTKTTENIYIYSDQTPRQKKYLQILKEELNKRTEDGEKNLTIRYIKGVPTITVLNQKN